MCVHWEEAQTNELLQKIVQHIGLLKSNEGCRLKADESKALHLEYPAAAMAGQDPTGPAARREIRAIREKAAERSRQYILKKVNSSELSRTEIGSRAAEIRLKQTSQGNQKPQSLNRNKFFRKYDGFLKSGKSDDSNFIGLIYRIFDIRQKEIPRLSASERERIRLLEGLAHEPFNLFVQNYQLLNKYAVGICNTPELSSIPIGEPVEFAFYVRFAGGKSGADLGKLLTLYAAGVLRGEPCEACGNANTLLYQIKGELCRGSGTACSVCLECEHHGTVELKNKENVIDAAALRYDRIAPFPRTETRWTMPALIQALKAME